MKCLLLLNLSVCQSTSEIEINIVYLPKLQNSIVYNTLVQNSRTIFKFRIEAVK